MEICCAANLLGITAIIALLVVLLLNKKESYCLSEKKSLLGGDGTHAAKTYVFSHVENNGDVYFYISDGNESTYAISGPGAPSWLGKDNKIAISNVRPISSPYLTGKTAADMLFFGDLWFVISRYVTSSPNILEELKTMAKAGPIYMYPL